MRFRRGRRRTRRLAWFPNLGTELVVGETNIVKAPQNITFAISGDGDINFVEQAVTFDFGQERILQFAASGTPTETLNDIMGSGWQLRRVVGSMFCHRIPTGWNAADLTTNNNMGILLTAGLMVRKVGQDGGVVDTAENPMERRDIADPWIWRRSWILGQNARPILNFGLQPAEIPSGRGPATDDLQASFAQYPPTNVHYGSAADGPHVDQKCNRIIGPEDRLFWHFAGCKLPLNAPVQVSNGVSVSITWDLRYLGNLRRFTNRRNASR